MADEPVLVRLKTFMFAAAEPVLVRLKQDISVYCGETRVGKA